MAKRDREIDLKSLARSYTETAMRTITGLAQHANSEGVRLEASKLVLERGWGKPVQTQEQQHGGEIRIVVRNITEGSKAPQK